MLVELDGKIAVVKRYLHLKEYQRAHNVLIKAITIAEDLGVRKEYGHLIGAIY